MDGRLFMDIHFPATIETTFVNGVKVYDKGIVNEENCDCELRFEA